MKKLTRLLLPFVCFSMAATASAQGTTASLPKSKQLMVVVTDGWNNLQGKIFVFNRVNHHWVLKFSNAIVVGTAGLAVGDGIIPFNLPGAPVKHEGDKRSPAGIFTIGTAFGYGDKKDATWIKDHYVCASDTLICVDDAKSGYYNTLVRKDTAKTAYNSFEEMHMKKDYYKWGLFINHNSGKVVPGDGSCIFMHIWGNATEGTDGCTAMTEANMLRVLHWINAKNNPLLVQFPIVEYKKLRKAYGLPAVRI
ncbi:L,D-transpeptidase family protein [uncultured Mucilaginibacter sp.]|uniref:L,D-transpeptidase family protein n=1 Tax=uncultured Mucilaginibacter sp. TaxID=797541 RepID=UPI0025E0D26B|nr:L,D-transpeptidase family protein [uncultured Mucilaginibacter sp.]